MEILERIITRRCLQTFRRNAQKHSRSNFGGSYERIFEKNSSRKFSENPQTDFLKNPISFPKKASKGIRKNS